jgi:hypothetical protein
LQTKSHLRIRDFCHKPKTHTKLANQILLEAPNWGLLMETGPMESTGLTLAQLLPLLTVLFSISLFVFGSTGGYYDTDSYDGNGTAH